MKGTRYAGYAIKPAARHVVRIAGFVFGGAPGMPRNQDHHRDTMLAMTPRLRLAGKWILLWTPVLATVAGYAAYRVFDAGQIPWFRRLFVIGVGLNLLALLAQRLVYRQAPLALLAGCAWLAAALFQAGLGPSAAVAIFGACAIGIGSLATEQDRPDGLAALLVGIAVITGLAGWLLPFHVHTRLWYSLAAALVILLRATAIRSAMGTQAASLAAALREAPLAAWGAINVLGLCSTPLWLPTMQADDISYHLALPYQLQDLGYYRMDVSGSLWAIAPWAADLVQAIPQVLGGEEARGPVNLMWMLALYAGMWRLGRTLLLPPVVAWAAIALHASVPLTSSLLGGMQTELPASAILVVLVLVIAEAKVPSPRRLLRVAALAGLLLAIKVSNALLLLPVAAWLLVRLPSVAPLRAFPASLVLGAGVAVPSYAYAWLVTGNPVFPFLNAVFKSPYFAIKNWKDPMWLHPLDATLPWQLTFDTPSYLVGGYGSAGFAYLMCVPGLVLGLFNARVRPVALLGLVGFALVFAQVHFIRYTHPATALLILAALAGFCATGLHRSVAAAVAILCTLNLGVVNSGYWQLHDGAVRMLLRSGKHETIRRFAPQRTVAARIRERAGEGSRALFHRIDAGGNAELTIPALTTSWYNWKLATQANAADGDDSGARWREILRDTGTTVLVVDRTKLSNGLKTALQEGAAPAPELSEGNFDAWRLGPRRGTPLTLLAPQTTADFAVYGYAEVPAGSKVSTRARFRCNLPGEPIVISVAAVHAASGSQENLISAWAMCQKDGFAEGEVQALVPADATSLSFIAWPRTRMAFEMLESRSEAQAAGASATADPALAIREKLLGGLAF